MMNLLSQLNLLFETPSSPSESGWTLLGLAIIGVAASSIPAYFLYKGNRELSLKDAEIAKLKNEKDTIQQDLAKIEMYREFVLDIIENWSEVVIKLNNLFKTTNAKRFLMFIAQNGLTDPQFTTAITQYRENKQEYPNYERVELDEDYIKKLQTLRRKKFLQVVTANEGNTKIGQIYRSETPKVKSANWFIIAEHKQKTGEVFIIYCSFGNYTDETFTETEETKQLILVDLIKSNFDTRSFNLHNSKV